MIILYIFGALLLISGLWLTYIKYMQQPQYELLLDVLKQQNKRAFTAQVQDSHSNETRHLNHQNKTSELIQFKSIKTRNTRRQQIKFIDELMQQIDFQLSPMNQDNCHIKIWIPDDFKDQLMLELRSALFIEELYRKIDVAIGQWIVVDHLGEEVQHLPRQFICLEAPNTILLEWKVSIA